MQPMPAWCSHHHLQYLQFCIIIAIVKQWDPWTCLQVWCAYSCLNVSIKIIPSCCWVSLLFHFQLDHTKNMVGGGSSVRVSIFAWRKKCWKKAVTSRHAKKLKGLASACNFLHDNQMSFSCLPPIKCLTNFPSVFIYPWGRLFGTAGSQFLLDEYRCPCHSLSRAWYSPFCPLAARAEGLGVTLEPFIPGVVN